MKQRFIMALIALMLVQGAVLALPSGAFAQTAAPSLAPAAAPEDTNKQCTHFAEAKDAAFGTSTTTTGSNGQTTTTNNAPGLLSEIYNYVKEVVGQSTERLYSTFIESTAYKSAVFGALTLMVVIFGVGFVIGVIQPSFGQVLIRLVKFGLIVALISPGGWNFFNHYVVGFFNDGTDELVKTVTQIGMGSKTALPADATPFYQFDKLAQFLIRPDTLIAIAGATFAGGPYGLMIGGLTSFAFFGFVGLLIAALRTYAVSYVARSLLLGLAPVFFVFLLFEKTKQMFMTWINALLSLSLQPILLFTFLSFFMVLLESASKDMLSTEFCWTEYRNEEGTTNKRAFWRPTTTTTNANGTTSRQPIVAEMTWQGTFDCIVNGNGTGSSKCAEFPANIVDILSFLILVYLAQRFATIIERMANELANTYIALDSGGRFDQFLQSNKGSSALGQSTSSFQRRADGGPSGGTPSATSAQPLAGGRAGPPPTGR